MTNYRRVLLTTLNEFVEVLSARYVFRNVHRIQFVPFLRLHFMITDAVFASLKYMQQYEY